MSWLMTSRKRKHRCGTSVKGDEREEQLDKEMEDSTSKKGSLALRSVRENRETVGALLRTMGWDTMQCCRLSGDRNL